MTREEKIICKEFLNDADKTHSCNEYKLLMNLIEQETVSKESYDHEYFLRKEFEIKIDELQHQLEEQAVKAESILDKIREEAEQRRKMYLDMNDIDWLNGCDYVLSVVDKYKSEK
jgi:hypothetical protein